MGVLRTGITSNNMGPKPLKSSETISVSDAAVQTDTVEQIDLQKALDPPSAYLFVNKLSRYSVTAAIVSLRRVKSS